MKRNEGMIMYKLRKVITAATEAPKEATQSAEAKFSYKDICDFLMSIEELQGQKITAVELADGSYEFTIGNMVYTLVAD